MIEQRMSHVLLKGYARSVVPNLFKSRPSQNNQIDVRPTCSEGFWSPPWFFECLTRNSCAGTLWLSQTLNIISWKDHWYRQCIVETITQLLFYSLYFSTTIYSQDLSWTSFGFPPPQVENHCARRHVSRHGMYKWNVDEWHYDVSAND